MQPPAAGGRGKPSETFVEDVVRMPATDGDGETYGLVIVSCVSDFFAMQWRWLTFDRRDVGRMNRVRKLKQKHIDLVLHMFLFAAVVHSEPADMMLISPYIQLDPGQLEVIDSKGKHNFVAEELVTVVDRGFMAGDIVKLAGSKASAQAGIVTQLQTMVQLERVLTGEKIASWIKAEDVVASARIVRGDHVVFGHWVGMVEDVFEVAMVESGAPGSLLRRVCDTGNTLSVGSTAEARIFRFKFCKRGGRC